MEVGGGDWRGLGGVIGLRRYARLSPSLPPSLPPTPPSIPTQCAIFDSNLLY